jgi:hypothetical protein
MKVLAGLDVGSERTTVCVWMGVARSFGEVLDWHPEAAEGLNGYHSRNRPIA